MNKLYVLVLIFFAFVVDLEAKKFKGQIIFDHGSVDVTLQIPVDLLSQTPKFEKLQDKVTYFDKNGVKIRLFPHQAKEIKFSHKGESIRMVSVKNVHGLGNFIGPSKTFIFLRLIADGNLRLLNYYYTQNTGGYNAATGGVTGGQTTRIKPFFKKNEGSLRPINSMSFRKDMIAYFEDCPTLSDKINTKKFRKRDLKAIVKYYNSNCL